MDLYSWINEHIRPFLVMVFTAICSVFTPIEDAIYVLFLAFIFNIIVGISQDKRVNKKEFNIKKAFDAITQLFLYYALIYLIHTTGFKMKDDTVATTGVKWVTYIVVYFYATNILRNAKSMYPKNKAIAFMYDVLSTDVFISLKNMIGVRTKKQEEDKE